jgi:predicted dehydrogenase
LWHPNPGVFFGPGAGPVLDVGPYFITALINLLGPIAAVAGMSRMGPTHRRIPRPDGTVEQIPVSVDTHASASLRFASGAVGTIVASFDIWDHELPFIEVYGAEGTLALPHPNWYDGEVKVRRHDDRRWWPVPPVLPPVVRIPGEKIRGLGVLDLAGALRGGLHRTSAELACHTLEVLDAIQLSSDEQRVVEIGSGCDRPAPVSPDDFKAWGLP